MSDNQMIINYVPGEECRVAIVEDGKLEEYAAEKFASASRVGNIYVGKVMNVEPAIQAAFIDFGVGENGFLHVSDLHPRYFPGEAEDTTERVGLKTPRRERPPMQASLRRGDEVIVQVLKEGVGTKGPTLTSYLSIPGRFLVMMPYMDRTGVSRKVEDEEQRRQMREILDQLDLPEGFGFIVRTAGMERTKMELKRDLAYLQRLWKDMERRLKAGGKPRLLYSESDLLVRSLRDQLTTDVTEVIIDHPIAVQRAARFMKIVAPRGQAKLLHFKQPTPIFHAYGVEQQVALIHAREVPLPSGGRLVLDQTEALVAIDVNSGKSRDSRNSEDNAYQTNIEAVDEICRQLRLRDMGGIVVNDLIDMRHASHRKDIENRFKERLKRDRARSTVLQINEFGILQLTRQRMRASHESIHFVDCPTCRGRGLVQKPDSIAADSLRELAAILDVERIQKVEMAVAPRVAGELLSTKRQQLGRIERACGKHVDVRVSEAVPVDRVSFYAYDGQGQDIDLTNLPKPKKPRDLEEITISDAAAEASWAPDEEEEKKLAAEPEPSDGEELDPADVHPIEIDEPFAEEGGEEPRGEGEDRGDGRRRRRRRRGGRGRGRGEGEGGDRGARGEQRREPPRDGPREGQRSGPPQARGDSRGSSGVLRAVQPVRPPVTQKWMNAGDHGDADDLPIDAAPIGPGTAFAGMGDDGHPLPPEAQSNDLDGELPPESEAGGGETETQPRDPNAPDGGRRRRRRRRRGRGRGGEGTMQPDGPGGPARAPMGEPGDRRTEGSMDDSPAPEAQGGGPDDGPEGEFEGGPGEEGDGAPRAEGSGQPADGEGGVRRRRRRRRRGRGGRGLDGAQGGPQDGPRGVQDGAPRGEQRPSPQPESRREDRPAPRPAPRSEPRMEARPEARPQPASGPAPRPKTLYGNVRRKLSPGELNKRPKPE